MTMTEDDFEREALVALHGLRAAVRKIARNDYERGAALRECVAKGWTIADLARELHVTRGTIYRWMAVPDADAD